MRLHQMPTTTEFILFLLPSQILGKQSPKTSDVIGGNIQGHKDLNKSVEREILLLLSS